MNGESYLGMRLNPESPEVGYISVKTLKIPRGQQLKLDE